MATKQHAKPLRSFGNSKFDDLTGVSNYQFYPVKRVDNLDYALVEPIIQGIAAKPLRNLMSIYRLVIVSSSGSPRPQTAVC